MPFLIVFYAILCYIFIEDYSLLEGGLMLALHDREKFIANMDGILKAELAASNNVFRKQVNSYRFGVVIAKLSKRRIFSGLEIKVFLDGKIEVFTYLTGWLFFEAEEKLGEGSLENLLLIIADKYYSCIRSLLDSQFENFILFMFYGGDVLISLSRGDKKLVLSSDKIELTIDDKTDPNMLLDILSEIILFTLSRGRSRDLISFIQAFRDKEFKHLLRAGFSTKNTIFDINLGIYGLDRFSVKANDFLYTILILKENNEYIVLQNNKVISGEKERLINNVYMLYARLKGGN